jgi:hypothetical protein
VKTESRGWSFGKEEKMKRVAILGTVALSLALCGCDMVSSVKDGLAQSEEAAVAIEKQVGVKPQVGFNYNNGSFTAATVQFSSMPAANLQEVEKVSRSAVIAAFKNEPENLVVSFVFRRGA